MSSTKSRTVEFPFPLGGVDSNWAYSNQPKGTTPDCSNVRAYSADAQRARGGSRPGLKRAYTQQIGGEATPLQWLGWLDYGFGDVFNYDDAFEYSNASLNVNADWSGNSEVKALDGYVHLEGTLSLSGKSVSYASFAGDTWDDFELAADISWSYGATGAISMWSSSVSGAADDGAMVTVAFTSSKITAPGAGFESVLKITLTSGANSSQHTRSYGLFFSSAGGRISVRADGSIVRAFWNDDEVAAVSRDDGTCNSAGFSMSMSNPAAGESWFPDSMIDFRIHDWRLAAATRATAVSRKLVAIAGNDLYAESTEGTLAEVKANFTAQTAALLSAAYCNGNLFIVDGDTPRYYNPLASAPDEVQTWTASQGLLPSTCSGLANWRNRLVLFASPHHPQNYYMSRQGNPWDFDFSCDDPQSAVSSDLLSAGRIGDPIQAVCPLNDDTIVFGCSRSIWVLDGDPAQGGIAQQRSDRTGILSANAWATDPSGNLYFLGEEGLYRMTPGGRPENITATRIPELGKYKPVPLGQAGASGEYYISLAYDADRHGLMIFLTPYDTSAAVHYFYDLRNDALFPESYHDSIGPTCGAFYNATTPTYRKLLLGGRNGFLYEFDESTASDIVDDQTTAAISSHVWLAPQSLSENPSCDSLISSVAAVMSSGSDAVTYGVHSADTLEGVLSATALATGTWSAGRNSPDRTRIRGAAHSVKISNSTAGLRWAIERIWASVLDAGEVR